MTSDPAHHLTDVGDRLLRTVRTFFEVPAAPRLPGAYSDALLDPLAVLSGVCGELLGLETPAAAEADDMAPTQTVFLPRPNGDAVAGSASSPPRDASRTGTSVAFPDASLWKAPASVHRREDLGISGTSSPADRGSHVRLAGALDPHQDASVSRPEDPVPPDALGSWEQTRPAGPAREDPQRALRARPAMNREDRAPGERNSAGPPSADGGWPVRPGETLPEGSGAASPARRVLEEDYRLETFADPPESAGFAREDPDRHLTGSSRPGTVRLASDARRLAAVLRAHASDPSATFRGDETEPLAPAEEGGERRDPASDRLSVEEVVERLADELETEFVRTYGSSGV